MRFSLKAEETPKMEDVYIELKGNLIISANSTSFYHRTDPIRKRKNPEILTLSFSAGFYYKRKKRERSSQYGFLNSLKQ